MSNVIPIVSSSPPPMDDGGGFDDWGEDDDDFGGFMGADQTTNSWNTTETKTDDLVNANVEKEKSIDNLKKISSSEFGSFKENISDTTGNCNNNDNDSDFRKSKHIDNFSRDSGLFDVSPTPISEDTKSDNSDDTCSPDRLDHSENSSELKSDSFENLTYQKDSPEKDLDSSENSKDSSNILSDLKSDESEPIGSAFQSTPDDIPDINNDSSFENIGSLVENDTKIAATEQNTEGQSSSVSSQISDTDHISSNSSESPPQNISSHNNDENTPSQIDEIENNSSQNLSKESEDFSGSKESNNSQQKDLESDSNVPVQTIESNSNNSVQHLHSNCDIEDKNDNSQETKIVHVEESSITDENVQSLDPSAIYNDDETSFANFDTTNEKSSSDQGSENENQEKNSALSDDNDFNDFADFSSAPNEDKGDTEEKKQIVDQDGVEVSDEDHDKNCDDVSSEQNLSNDDNKSIEEDEFAEFSSAPVDNDVSEDQTQINDPDEVEKAQNDDEKSSTSKTDQQSSKDVENEIDDDGFADFSSAPNAGSGAENKEEKNIEETVVANQDECDDDDFADFNSAPFSDDGTKHKFQDSENKSSSFEPVDNDDGDGNDFAEFSSSKAVPVDNGDDADDFAEFSSSKVDPVDDGGDDFADFSSAPEKDDDFTAFSDNKESSDDGWATFQQPEKTSQQEPVTTKQIDYGGVLNGCFDDVAPDIADTSDLEFVVVEEKTSEMWIKLQSIDNTGLLKWTQCTANKNLYVSLKIDTKNILLGYKKPTVPIYAANLTLLEPTKGTGPLLQPETSTLVDTNKQDEVKDLPPVQFDWTTSGLTNPLEDNSKRKSLDFLTVDDQHLTAKTKAFDSDLIHGQRPAMQPLQSILANLKVTKKTRLEDLSDEAGRVISHLPDLSFMKAKVLMFPLKQ